MDTFDRIMLLLNENHMTQADLARATGISTGLISQWKNRDQKPSAEKLKLIAAYFNVSTDYLLDNEPQKAPAKNDELKMTEEDFKFALFGGDGMITDEMYDEVKRFAQFIKQRERGKGEKQ
ncbi:MAG: helix-turn-helix transcriptional regulator [Clostridiaceae bacterium]|nr:helix-turn-helix transcriptional regulator [Clostridiaceae bacterium]